MMMNFNENKIKKIKKKAKANLILFVKSQIKSTHCFNNKIFYFSIYQFKLYQSKPKKIDSYDISDDNDRMQVK